MNTVKTRKRRRELEKYSTNNSNSNSNSRTLSLDRGKRVHIPRNNEDIEDKFLSYSTNLYDNYIISESNNSNRDVIANLGEVYLLYTNNKAIVTSIINKYEGRPNNDINIPIKTTIKLIKMVDYYLNNMIEAPISRDNKIAYNIAKQYYKLILLGDISEDLEALMEEFDMNDVEEFESASALLNLSKPFEADTVSSNINMAVSPVRVVGPGEKRCADVFCTPDKKEYLESILKMADTYHDFWGSRGSDAVSRTGKLTQKRITAYLYYLLTNTIANFASKYKNTSSIIPRLQQVKQLIFDKRSIFSSDGFKELVEVYRAPKKGIIEKTKLLTPDITPYNNTRILDNNYRLKPITNDLFNILTGVPNAITLSNLEPETAYNVMCLPAPLIQKNGTKSSYKAMIPNLFKGDVTFDGGDTPSHNIFIICDAGPGLFGKSGTYPGSRLTNVITQCTVADSANTPVTFYGDSTGVSNNPLVELNTSEVDKTQYCFIPTEPNLFISDSNIFTKENTLIGYNDKGVTFNKLYDIELNIKIGDTPHSFAFGPQMNGSIVTQGPSAALLSAYFILANLKNELDRPAGGAGASIEHNFFNEASIAQIQATIHNYIMGKRPQILQLGDMWNVDGLNPGLFLDIKRGGDRDQVITASILKDMLDENNAKIREIPELIPSKVVFCTGDLLCATIAVRKGLATVYQRGNIMEYWPENTKMCYSRENATTTTAAAMKLNGGGEETPAITIIDFIGDCMSIAVHSKRSKISSLYPEVSSLCSLYILKNQIDRFYKTVSPKTQELLTKVKNVESYADFKLKNAFDAFKHTTKINTGFITLKDILTKDRAIIISKVNQKLEELEKSLQINYQTQQEIKNSILNDSKTDKYTITTLRTLISDKYDTDPSFIKSLSVPLHKQIYTYLKNIIFLDSSIDKNHNPYSSAIISLSLLNDFVNNNINTGVSVVSKMIYGQTPIKYIPKPLTNTTLGEYSILFKNIYENSKGKGDFMGVSSSLSKNITQSRQLNKFKKSGLHVKKFVPAIPLSYQQPGLVAATAGGKRRINRTHKRNRKQKRSIYTHRRNRK